MVTAPCWQFLLTEFLSCDSFSFCVWNNSVLHSSLQTKTVAYSLLVSQSKKYRHKAIIYLPKKPDLPDWWSYVTYQFLRFQYIQLQFYMLNNLSTPDWENNTNQGVRKRCSVHSVFKTREKHTHTRPWHLTHEL